MITWSKFKEVFKKDFWICFGKYIRGTVNIAHEKYDFAINDFNWILENGGLPATESLIYVNLGVAYARLNNFKRAEECLTKATEYESNKSNGELYQWLGYISCVRDQYKDAIEYFRKAFALGQRGIDRWLVNQEYVKNNIIKLDKIIREENRDIFPNFGD